MSDDDTQTPAEQPAEQAPPAETVSADAPPTPGAGYRVALDAYCGPLDLLLYLIRKSEVDINDIPVAHITEQYQRHIDLMAEINVNVAGEFLVMAATLMEIKSRMLLPREEGLEGEEEEDPRAELVRQLLEYKRYKDLARELGDRAAQQALKFPRPEHTGPEQTPAEAAEDGANVALEGIGLWELVDAFAKVLSETSIGPPKTQLLERERPLHEFRRDLLEFVRGEDRTTFTRVFANCKGRDEMIATFVALLELVRLHQLTLQQADDLGELYVMLASDTPQPAPITPVDTVPAEQPRSAPEAPAGGRFKPVNEVDALDELDEDAESLGRARERIEAAISSAEAFLREHHEQARQEESQEEPNPESQPGGSPAAPQGDEPPPADDAAAAPSAPEPEEQEEDPPHAPERPALD